MIIKQFQSWAQNASSENRADGASALARAYLHSNLDDGQKREAIAVLTGFLDDPSTKVRRALADAFANATDAPHHIILALADDQSSVSAVVLCYSPLLSDAELIDCAAAADDFAQSAIASRPGLSAPVAAALAEIGCRDALTALAHNHAATLRAFSIHRIIERHGDHAELREALLARPDLPASARIDLVAATMRALGTFVTQRNWMSDERVTRVAREAKDKAAIVIAETSRSWPEALALATHLRNAGELTVGFAFRTIHSGRIDLFKATLTELSGMPIARVDGLTEQSASAGFAAVYRKAELPLDLLPAFRIALHAARCADWPANRVAGLSRDVIDRVIAACEALNEGALDKLLVLLRRFETEAAREEVRDEARASQKNGPLALGVSRLQEPLTLTDLDTDDRGVPAIRAELTPRRASTLLMIDMAALEAELASLTNLDKDDHSVPAIRGELTRRREPTLFKINMAALEAELSASLTDLDTDDRRLPAIRGELTRRREPTLFTIDMAALEAELSASLTDLDTDDRRLPAIRGERARRREPTLFTIDMAALEAELIAA